MLAVLCRRDHTDSVGLLGFQQTVDAHTVNLGQRAALDNVRDGGAPLPFGIGLAGDSDSPGNLFLGIAIQIPKHNQVFLQHHTTSSQIDFFKAFASLLVGKKGDGQVKHHPEPHQQQLYGKILHTEGI